MTPPIWLGLDTETHKIEPGLLIPPIVCLTLAGPGDYPAWLPSPGAHVVVRQHGSLWKALYTGPAIEAAWGVVYDDAIAGKVHAFAHNAPYDIAVLTEHVGGDPFELLGGPTLDPRVDLPAHVSDTKLREQLLAIAEDRLDFDRRTGEAKKAKFHLSDRVLAYFGVDISEAKTDPNAWRLRYAELDGIPAADWPEGAVSYAMDDAVWALAVAVAQSEPQQGPAGDAAKAPLVDADGWVNDEFNQIRASYALHLESVWGVRVDNEEARAFAAEVHATCAIAEDIAQRAGLLRPLKPWRRPRAGDCAVCEAPGPLSTTCVDAQGRSVCPVCKSPGTKPKNMEAFYARVEAAYTARGLPTPRTDSGRVATDRDTLEMSEDPVFTGTPCPVCEVAYGADCVGEPHDAKPTPGYAELGPSIKLRDTYLPILDLGAYRPINAGFNALVATGRTSCREPNLQNPTRQPGFRECFVPRAGWVYCSVDYDIAELKSLAQLQYWWFGTSALGDIINPSAAWPKGQDPHLALGASLWASTLGRPVDYAEIKAVPKKIGHEHYEAGHGAYGARQLAKIGNFGFPGGLSARSFVDYARTGYGVRLSEDTAYTIRMAWFDRFPEMSQYFDMIGRLSDTGSYCQVQQVSERQRGGVTFTVAANGYFQGLTADYAKDGTYRLVREAHGGGLARVADTEQNAVDLDTLEGRGVLGIRPVLFVHDENISEIPTEAVDKWWTPRRVTAAARRKSAIMCQSMADYLPNMNATAEPCLMSRWSKGAETLWNADGTLAVWSPKPRVVAPAAVR